MKKAPFVRLAVALLFSATPVAAIAAPMGAAPAEIANAPQIEGVWLTQSKSQITVSPCATDFCGNISKIVVPDDIYKQNKKAIESIGATNFTDEMNKDPKLKGRPIMGLQILTLHPSDKPQIYNGEIYNPEDGNTYSGYVEVLGPNKIRLNGCILYNIICKGEDWTRVPLPPVTEPGMAPAPSTPVAQGTFQ
ncbi:MAG TPA: DUF2147 domain-containing protein [Devosiaceae bacterium]|nr:DUF2147 domain-containing protein [Devosiaceae bacterium]